jgi:hypothetical protein
MIKKLYMLSIFFILFNLFRIYLLYSCNFFQLNLLVKFKILDKIYIFQIKINKK